MNNLSDHVEISCTSRTATKCIWSEGSSPLEEWSDSNDEIIDFSDPNTPTAFPHPTRGTDSVERVTRPQSSPGLYDPHSTNAHPFKVLPIE